MRNDVIFGVCISVGAAIGVIFRPFLEIAILLGIGVAAVIVNKRNKKRDYENE